MTDSEVTEPTPRPPVQVVMASLGWKDELILQIKKQGPVAILLIVVLVVLYMQWQSDRVASETHQTLREQISADAIKHAATETANIVQKMGVEHTQRIKELSDTFRAEQDRTERILGNKIMFNNRRVDAVAEKLDRLMP